ncbi:MAG: hypothetical protein LBD07_04885 [Spirochaetaceae bacterium]|jgi:ribonucleoside-triphosphate reductase|nr:hypothetical protein [Spirochaetaceae bacterium]
MRTLEEIEKDLEKAREALSNIEGGTAEVYSRIVGYYRSVRNWNKGKREEYGERKLYDVDCSLATVESRSNADEAAIFTASLQSAAAKGITEGVGEQLVLFVQPGCPACPSVKSAAVKLGVPVKTVDASTNDGLDMAAKYNIMSTPTAILFDKDGKEVDRARDSASIARFNRYLIPEAALKSA